MSPGFFERGHLRSSSCKDPRASATSCDQYINSRDPFNIIIRIVAYVLFAREMMNRDNATFFQSSFPELQESIARERTTYRSFTIVIVYGKVARHAIRNREIEREGEKERRLCPGTDSQIAFVRFIAAVYTA